MENQTFRYNGNPITFQIGDSNTMINATEMAKPFGKRVRQWFDNESTHEFVETLAIIRKISPIAEKRTSLNTSNLAERYPMFLKVFQGGMAKNKTQGTWMHEDLALEFARWLSPEFAIWCNDRIKEILKGQSTSQLNLSSDREIVLAQAFNRATELMKGYVPQMWQPHCDNAIAPLDFTKITSECQKDRPDVFVDGSDVARYMAGQGFIKLTDGYYFPTQSGIDFGVFNITDVSFHHQDGQHMKFGLPVLTGTGVACITPKVIEMKIRENFIKYPPIVN